MLITSWIESLADVAVAGAPLAEGDRVARPVRDVGEPDAPIRRPVRVVEREYSPWDGVGRTPAPHVEHGSAGPIEAK